MEINDLACDPQTVALHYCWDFSLNIKTAGKISRLTSINHDIKYTLSEEGTMA